MAANTSPIFELTPFGARGCQLTNATGTTKTIVATAGTNGTRIDQIACSTTDTSAETLSFWIALTSSPTTYYHLADVSLAIGAGYTTVARVDAVATLAPTLGYIVVEPTYSLYVNVGTAVTSGKQTDIVAQGGDF